MAPKKKKGGGGDNGGNNGKPRPPPIAAPESPPPKGKVPAVAAAPAAQVVEARADEDRQRNVLVTGGTGLLGRPVVRELVRRGFKVVCMSSKPQDRLHPEVQRLLADIGVTHIGLDLAIDVQNSGGKALGEAVVANSIDLIVNLAADRGGVTWDGTRKAMNHAVLNTELPGCLSKMATELKLRVLHVSTEYVWCGDNNSAEGYPATPIGEDGERRFVKDELGAPYALQKRDSELKIADNELCTVLRLPVLFGPMVNALEDGTAGRCIDNFLNSNDLKHDTWQRRYPTSTLDCAFVIGALASKLFCAGLRKRVYNYGAQTSLSKHGMVAMFSKAAGVASRQVLSEDLGAFAPGKRPPFDVRLNISETRAELEDDWREPQSVDEATMKAVWLPFFAARVEQLNDAGAGARVSFPEGEGMEERRSQPPLSARHSSQIDMWYQVKRSSVDGCDEGRADEAPLLPAVCVERPATPHHSGASATLSASVDVDRPNTPHHSDDPSLRTDVEVERPATPHHSDDAALRKNVEVDRPSTPHHSDDAAFRKDVEVDRPLTPHHGSNGVSAADGLPLVSVEIERPLTPHHSDEGVHSMDPSVAVDRPDTPHHRDKSNPVRDRPPTPYPSTAELCREESDDVTPVAAAVPEHIEAPSSHDKAQRPAPPPQPKAAGWCSCGARPQDGSEDLDPDNGKQNGSSGCIVS